MKKYKIKAILKSNIESHVPNQKMNVDWNVLFTEKQNIIMRNEKTPTSKLLLSFKMTLSTVFILAMVVLGFNLLNNKPSEITINPYADSAYQSTLSVSAVSTATLMSQFTPTTLTYTRALSMITVLSSIETVTTIEPFLGMIETVTGQNQGILTESVTSDNPAYTSKVILTSIDLLGTPIEYVLYFNTVSYTEKDQHVQFTIEGIFLYKGLQFDFLGKREVEETDEIIYFKTVNDAMNYVESTYKTEDDESKYTITIVENGIVTSQNKIKITNEDGNQEIKFEYRNGLDYGTYKFKYEQENDKNILKILYQTMIANTAESGQMKVEIKTDAISGLTSYQIYVQPDDEDEYEYESERKVDRDHEEEDDDHSDDENDSDRSDDE